MAKIIIKDSEISSSAGINIPGNLSIAGDTTIGDLFTDSLIVNASTTFNEDVDAKDIVISSSFKGDGSQLQNLTASNISNFTNDVRSKFSAGTNITISNGVISSGGGGGTPGGTDTTVQFNSGSTFSGSSNLVYNYATNTLSGTTAQFTSITGSIVTGSTALFTTLTGSRLVATNNLSIGKTGSNAVLDVNGNSVISGTFQVVNQTTTLYNTLIGTQTDGETYGPLTVDTVGSANEGGIVLIAQDANDVAINYNGDYKLGIDTSDGNNFKVSYGQPTIYGLGTIIGGAQLGTNDILIISKALSGSVGIGTTGSLTEKLIVSGNIKATGTGIISGSSGQFTSITGSHSGNSTTATTLQTPRTISSTGDVVWSVTFDGSGNAAGSAAIGSGVIVNADINASAGIADTKLATISTAGKVSNSATTATSANTANAIVSRDASGNFTAGTITATLAGNASTVTNGVYTTTIASHATTGVTAGSGLTGGGTVGSLTVNVGAGDGISVAADTVAVDSTVLRTTGNQTVGGQKTFTSYITGSITGSDAKFTSITGSLSGNSTTATTLQNARNINGTSFNGSADITTTNWGTARNITIGNTTRSVNGSTTYSWSLADIGAQAAGNYVTNLSVVSANGLSGTVANSTSTPAITLSTTVNGLLQGNGTAISAATVGTSLTFTGGTLSRSALTGDVTAAANNNATTIANNAVSFAKMQDISTDCLIGRDAAGSGDPTEITLVSGDLVFNGSNGIGLATSGVSAGSYSAATITVDAKGRVISATDNPNFVSFQGTVADNGLARFDGTSGKFIQDGSGITLSDAGAISRAGNISITATGASSDINITAGDDLVMTGNDIGYLQAANATVEGSTTSKIIVSSQKVEATTASINIDAGDIGANINITAADNITNTIGYKSQLKIRDITAGDISTFDYVSITNKVRIRNPAGSAATPSYSFDGDTNTGIYSPVADNISLSTAGIERVNINASGNVGIGTTPTQKLTVSGNLSLFGNGSQVFAGFGSVSKPSYSFVPDESSTGLASIEAHDIDFICDGTTRMRLKNFPGEIQLFNSLTLQNTSVTSTTTPQTFDASSSMFGSWIASFGGPINARISNLTDGRFYILYVRNTNGTARVLTITASTTAASYVNVNFSRGGAVSVQSISLAATSGTATVLISRIGSTFIGAIF